MTLAEIVTRPAMTPWSGDDKIPWNDPEFSVRMLREHLSQEHDAASRRFTLIDDHVDWIHRELLRGRPSRILDLACGPGFYSHRLAARGHQCVGIDFSPASIEYARTEARQADGKCEFHLRDIRQGEFGTGHDLVLFVYGEINVFRRTDAERILADAHTALGPGGILVLEAHTKGLIEETGRRPASWRTSMKGLFLDAPHICLEESTWCEEEAAAVVRYFVIDVESGSTAVYRQTIAAYGEDEYRALFHRAGFPDPQVYGSMSGDADPDGGGFTVLVGRKLDTRQE